MRNMTVGVAFATLFAFANAQEVDAASADRIVQTGLRALKLIDEDQAAQIWDDASAFVKTAKPQAAFVEEIRRARLAVGSVAGRDWASIARIRYVDAASSPPPGLYANVDYATRLTDGRTLFEKLSFRLEPAGWRLTGYEPRQHQ